jgi:hypothetical protein
MTVQIDGTQLGEIVELASLVGTIVAALIASLIVYLLVRPPRHVRERRRAEGRGEPRAEAEPIEAEELRQIVERMEARLDVLERALADQHERPAIGRRDNERILTPVESGRDL